MMIMLSHYWMFWSYIMQMQYLPEKVDEKAVEFAKYLSDYMYGDFYVQFKEYEIDDIEHQEIVTYSKSKF